VPTNEGSWQDLTVWTPVCEATGAAGSCPAPMCKWSAGLLEVSEGSVGAISVKRHRFLGTALFQASAVLGHSDGLAKTARLEEL